MSLKFLRQASGRALVVAAMTAGLIGATAAVASASTTPGNKWYVATSGTDTNNDCAVKTNPCATIDHALAEQAASGVTGTIHVKAGTYSQQVLVGAGNSNVVIDGAGASTTTIDAPSAGLASDTDTDSSEPQFYVVDVSPGISGVTLENFSVNGTTASSFLDGDGDSCSQSFVGVYYHESSGTISDVDVTGIDLPGDLFGCQGGTGIYVNSSSSDHATVSMTGVSELTTAFTSLTKAALPAGTYSQDILPVKAEPAGWTSGSVAVNGYIVSASADGPKDLFITGTTSTASPDKSVVNYDPYTPAYDKNGIACDDAYTKCTISGATIQGDGPQNGIGQNGILAWGSENVTIDGGTTVSNNTWTGGGGSGNAASGILLLNGGTFTVENSNVSDNDVNIYAGEIQAYGLVNPTVGTWTINDNIASGATSDGASAGEDGYGEGIQLDSTTNGVVVQDNQVSGSAQANLLLTGVSGATIGGPGTDQGNIFTDSFAGAGMVVGGPGTECEYAYGNSCAPGNGNPDQFSSVGNTFIDNSSTGNGAGLVVEGSYDPSLVGPADPDAAYSNTFTGNVWQGNLFANAADFSTEGSTNGPVQNSYSGNVANGVACNPTEGGSASLDGLSGGSTVADVTTTSGSPDITTTASGGFNSVSSGEGVTDGDVDITPGTTVSSTSGSSAVLSGNAKDSNSSDTLSFGNLWGC
ncbi:MAG: hypothetical protein WAM97_06085 [Acidimicrobiales bacterium]